MRSGSSKRILCLGHPPCQSRQVGHRIDPQVQLKVVGVWVPPAKERICNKKPKGWSNFKESMCNTVSKEMKQCQMMYFRKYGKTMKFSLFVTNFMVNDLDSVIHFIKYIDEKEKQGVCGNIPNMTYEKVHEEVVHEEVVCSGWHQYLKEVAIYRGLPHNIYEVGLKGGGFEIICTMEQEIMEAVHRAGLPFKLDEITPGDGNCLSHAVISQCRRPAIRNYLQENELDITDYRQLKIQVAYLALHSRKAAILNFKREYEASVQVESHEIWRDYWNRMKKDKVWADGIFIQFVAWYLKVDIIIVLTTATPEMPFLTICGNLENQGQSCDSLPLLLGSKNSLHYQSLLPIDEAPFHDFRPVSFRVLLKDALDTIMTVRKGANVTNVLTNTNKRPVPNPSLEQDSSGNDESFGKSPKKKAKSDAQRKKEQRMRRSDKEAEKAFYRIE